MRQSPARHAPAGVTLVPNDASRAALAAHLDASPHWHPHLTRRAERRGFRYWRLDPDLALALTGSTWLVVELPEDHVAQQLLREEDYRAGAARCINAVELRLDPRAGADAIDRLAEAHRLAPPGSPIAQAVAGRAPDRG